MTIARVQAPTFASNSGSSITKAFGSAVTAGSLLVAFATNDVSATFTFSSPGATWHTIASFLEPSSGQFISIGYAMNAPGGSTTVTCTFGGAGNFNSLEIAEYSGAATTSALDANTTGKQNSASTTPTDTSMTATGADLVVSALVLAAGGVTVTPGSGYSIIANDTGNLFISEDRVLSGSGSVATTWNLSGAIITGIMSAAFKPAGGGGGSDHSGAVTPTATATLSPAASHGRQGAISAAATATATPAAHRVHPAAAAGTVTATIGPAITHGHAAAISSAVTATMTPAASHGQPAAVTADATARLTPAAAADRAAAITADAKATLLLSPSGQNQGAATFNATAGLTPAATHTRTAAIAANIAAVFTLAIAGLRSAAVTAIATARFIATRSAGQEREIDISTGIPELGWRTGPPDPGWQTGAARNAWRTGPPRIS